MLTTYDMHLEGSEVVFPDTFGEFETVAKKLVDPAMYGYLFVAWLYFHHEPYSVLYKDKVWWRMLKDVKEKETP